MAAARFRAPKTRRMVQPPAAGYSTRYSRFYRGGKPGQVHLAECGQPGTPTPVVLRRSRHGLVNVRQPQQDAIRRDLKRKCEAATSKEDS